VGFGCSFIGESVPGYMFGQKCELLLTLNAPMLNSYSDAEQRLELLSACHLYSDRSTAVHCL
jgi:hypothetical protein